MKKQVLFFSLLMTFVGGSMAQSPQAIRYQGVARNSSGSPLNGASIMVRLGIRDGSASGPVVYLETHNVTTNQFGLYNLSIGQGVVQAGSFSTITWGSGAKFIEQEVDFGSGFQNMGVSQFVSVPYALYALNGGTPGPQGPQGPQGPPGPQGPAGSGWTLQQPSFSSSGQIVINGTSGSGGPVTSAASVWVEGGNNLAATGELGTTSNQHIDVLSNNAVRGRITNSGVLVWGSTTPTFSNALGNFVGTSTYPFPLTSYANAGSSGGAFVGLNGTGLTSNNSAVFGNNISSGSGAGVAGQYNGSNTGNALSGVLGIYAASVTSNGGAGVVGFNSADFSGNYNRMGVLGLYGSTNAYGIGVIGLGYQGVIPSSTTTDYGVVGWVGNNSNYAGYYNGNHVVTNGSKSASVPTTKGNQLLYVTESPEIWFEDLGGGNLVNGEATVNLDPLFLETVVIDNDHPMRVFVQMEGESEEVYVIKSATSFKVKERNNGNSNAAFSYRVMAKRLHFQDHRFGSDPVWGPGDTRQYSSYSTPPAIDYNENLKVQEQKRKAAENSPLPPGFIRASDLTKELNSREDGSR